MLRCRNGVCKDQFFSNARAYPAPFFSNWKLHRASHRVLAGEQLPQKSASNTERSPLDFVRFSAFSRLRLNCVQAWMLLGFRPSTPAFLSTEPG
jgi:hypothetical protein